MTLPNGGASAAIGSRPSAAEWAGEVLSEILRDPSDTARFLGSADARTCLAVLSIVAEHWPADKRFVSRALELAFGGPEPAVRGAALVALHHLRDFVPASNAGVRLLLEALFELPQGAELRSDFAQKLAIHERWWDARWRKAAGPHAVRMAESRDAAMSYLAHNDPQVRARPSWRSSTTGNPTKSSPDFANRCCPPTRTRRFAPWRSRCWAAITEVRVTGRRTARRECRPRRVGDRRSALRRVSCALLVTRGFSRGTESPEAFLRRAGLPVPRRRGLGAR